MQSDRHPQMFNFFGGYLNQDYELCGDTFEEVVEYFKRVNSRDDCLELVREIDAFMDLHPGDLNVAFEREVRPQVDYVYWGYTATTFLQELKRLLQD